MFETTNQTLTEDLQYVSGKTSPAELLHWSTWACHEIVPCGGKRDCVYQRDPKGHKGKTCILENQFLKTLSALSNHNASSVFNFLHRRYQTWPNSLHKRYWPMPISITSPGCRWKSSSSFMIRGNKASMVGFLDAGGGAQTVLVFLLDVHVLNVF